MKAVFIAGTDTDIGKTYVSCLLLKAFNHYGLTTFAIKPVASGCEIDSLGDLKNSDALALQRHASLHRSYEVVNPIAFYEPIAPHIAANKINFSLNKELVKKEILNSLQDAADINIIEGVGGWNVPLNDSELLADVVCDLNLPVVLVVGIKLGCLNHAFLTYQNMLARGVNLIGWVANCVDPKAIEVAANINTLINWIHQPMIGVVSYGAQEIDKLNFEVFGF